MLAPRAGAGGRGFIKGYRAEIDRRKIGLGVLAFVRLDADRNTGGLTQTMEEAIRKIPEVVSCHYISGTGTFELQVVARDLDSFSQFARDVLLPAQCEGHAHQLFAGRSQGQRCAAAEPPARQTILKLLF